MTNFIAGRWRSFKLFYFSGKIEEQGHFNYLEIYIDEAGNITITHSKNPRNPQTISADQWHIENIKNRRFIFFGKKQVYEIITMETALMVLSDIVKGEKIFFAKMPLWNEYVKPVQNPVKHIESRSKKKKN